MEDYTYYCNEIHNSLTRIRRGVGDRSYELNLAEDLLKHLPESSKRIYRDLIDKIKSV